MKFRIAIFLLISGFATQAQSPQLDPYIRQGLESNLVLQQKHLSLSNALNALKQARTYYLPAVDFQFMYSHADGGRSIDLPIGDMLNPVYTTLNQLLAQNVFGQIKNEQINFLPKNYQDTRVRLSVPILNTDIKNNSRIRHDQVAISEKEIEIYQRELIKEIKVSYYNYLSALQSVDIYQNAVDLAEEGRRTNQKLIESGRGLPAYLIRSEAEVVEASAKVRSAGLNAETARRYFNALLNRDADAPIDTAFAGEPRLVPAPAEASGGNREELESLQHAIELQEHVLRLNQQANVPKVNAFVDLGSQSEQLKFDQRSLYYMIGLQLTLPIYSGGRSRLKVSEAKNDLEIARLQKESVEQQLDVAAIRAYNDVLSARFEYESALKRLEAAETYGRLIHRGYSSGVNSYIETVDARSQVTSARIGLSLSYNRVMTALAVLERETASFPLSQYKNLMN